MDVWLVKIAIFLKVDEDSTFVTEIPATGGRLFLIGSSRKAQTGHNDILYRADKSSGYFKITNGPEEGNMCVSPRSHYYVYCEEENLFREISADGVVSSTIFFCVCWKLVPARCRR